MINSVKFLEKKLNGLFAKFPKSNIRYEYRLNRSFHIVEVTPLSFYNNDKYKIVETEIEDEFELLFPNENIIFISDNSLNKINNHHFELFSEIKGKVCLLSDNSLLQSYSFLNHSFVEYAEENNYALAA